jgi:lysophospholipase L1-like esterase
MGRRLISALICTSALLTHALPPPCPVAVPVGNDAASKSQSRPAEHQSSVLAAWQRNVSEAKTRPVNIVVLGDSIACCFGPADYENIWTNVLRQAEALRYRDHGSGVIPIGDDFGLSTNPQWSLHPQGGSIDTVPFGPYQAAKGAFGSVFRLKGDAQVTVLLPVRPADGITLYYASGTDSKAGIRVSYDDQSSVTVGQQNSPTLKAQRADIPLDGTGSSTVSFSAASTSGSAYIYGVEFTYGTAGVSLHNLAHGYARTEAWGGDPASQMAFLSQIRGGIQLAIVSLGINDSINGTGTTLSEYKDHMAAIITYLRSLDAAMPIVLFDEIPTVLGDSATTLPQSAVRAQEQLLATEFGVGYVSPCTSFGTPAEAIDRGYFSRDNLHPSDLGNRRIATVIEEYLQSTTVDRVP